MFSPHLPRPSGGLRGGFDAEKICDNMERLGRFASNFVGEVGRFAVFFL